MTLPTAPGRPAGRSPVTSGVSHLYELILERARRWPAATALGGEQGYGWKTVDSRALVALTDRLAAELSTRLGVTEGDRVVLWAPNAWRTPIYFFAIWKLGAVVVPFDREMNPGAAASILRLVEPRAVIVGFGERPAWAEGQPGLVEWWEPGSLGGEAPAAEWTRPREELATIYFTSGTTGNPKGCMITHRNLCTQVEAVGEVIALDPSVRVASILPLSHLFELTAGLLSPLAMGCAIHYVPSRRGPDIMRVMKEQRITHMVAVPQLLALMGKALDDQLRAKLPGPVYLAMNALADQLPLDARRRLFFLVHRRLGGHLRLIASGGAPLEPRLHRQWERIGVRIIQGYGTSECSPVVAAGRADGSAPIGSVGPPVKDVEVRLSPEGELLVRGPNVMRGYWKDPERTSEVLRDGWYATGDLARIDAGGNVWIEGRAKDLIVLPSGQKVWPQDVEDALRAHPAVKDAAVVAVPTAAGGATLHAFLIPASGEGSTDEISAVVAWANGRLAQHQRIATASWYTSESGDFPRTSTLKVRRHLLPKPDVAAATKVARHLDADDPVARAIADATRGAAPGGGQTLSELGVDSLGLVEVALALEEKTGKAVADGDLRVDMTVDEVRAFVAGLPEGAGERQQAPAEREEAEGEVRLWPYTWGRAFRILGAPFDLLYRLSVTRTVVRGAEHLAGLPPSVIVAGTHRSYPDVYLVRHALATTPARRLAGRLVVPAAAMRLAGAGALAGFAKLAFGLYSLDQHGEHSGRGPSLRGLARLAQAGNPILIFPQGKQISPAQEKSGDPDARFRPGVGHLAEALGAVVVPFGQAGSERLIPPNPPPGFRGIVIAGIPVALRRGPLAIVFGPPVRLEADETPRDFAERLERICFALSRRAEEELGERR